MLKKNLILQWLNLKQEMQGGKDFDPGFSYGNLKNRVSSSQKALKLIDNAISNRNLRLGASILGMGISTYVLVAKRNILLGLSIYGITVGADILFFTKESHYIKQAIKTYNEEKR